MYLIIVLSFSMPDLSLSFIVFDGIGVEMDLMSCMLNFFNIFNQYFVWLMKVSLPICLIWIMRKYLRSLMSRGRKWERPPHLGPFLKIPQTWCGVRVIGDTSLRPCLFPRKKNEGGVGPASLKSKSYKKWSIEWTDTGLQNSIEPGCLLYY